MKKLSLLAIGLMAALAAPAAFADDSKTGTVTANVPSTCEIQFIENVHGEFAANITSTSATGNIAVLCNKDAGYSLSTPSTDSAGRFTLNAISGTAGATMEAELRETVTGQPWSNTDLVGGQGTGQTVYHSYQVVFNPAGGVIPAVGSYTADVTVDLTATF